MKRSKPFAILNNSNIQSYINENINLSIILKKLTKELGKDNCPCRSTVQRYIKENLKLTWDSKKKRWISYSEDTESKTKNNQNYVTLKVNHENQIVEEDIIEQMNFLPNNQINNDSKTEEKSNTKCSSSIPSIEPINKEKENTTNTTSNNTNNPTSQNPTNIEKDKSTLNKDINLNRYKFKDEDIPSSEYGEYITASKNKKFSISINSFVIELVEQRICKKYNLNPKGNRSRIIETALTEYLRLTKQ